MKWILQVCKKLTQSFYAHKLAVLSGVLIGTSWIPFPPWALLFCMIPLWWQLSQETSLKSAFWAGWWTQFVLTLIGFFWIAYVTVVFGYMHWTVGGLVLLLFASFIHLHYAFASLIIVALKNKFRMGASWFFVLCAGIYSIAEWVWPAIFPWNLAYPLMATGASWVQWADVVGMLGLSFFY
jgi:apolipoprotein N-acyltransferase